MYINSSRFEPFIFQSLNDRFEPLKIFFIRISSYMIPNLCKMSFFLTTIWEQNSGAFIKEDVPVYIIFEEKSYYFFFYNLFT
jgi:hypothetical protein